MILKVLFWLATLLIAFVAGKVVSKLKLPAILGWLIAGMIFGPNALALLPQDVLDAAWYKTIIMWMQCAFGLSPDIRSRTLHIYLYCSKSPWKIFWRKVRCKMDENAGNRAEISRVYAASSFRSLSCIYRNYLCYVRGWRRIGACRYCKRDHCSGSCN